MATVTKDTIIGDILDMDRTTAPFFLEMGKMCIRDRSAPGHNDRMGTGDILGMQPNVIVIGLF